MRRLLLFLLILLMFCACGSEAEETTVPETAPEILETLIRAETTPPTTVPPTTVPPATVPPTTIPPTTEVTEPIVDESWFDDALFIGESRTAGLKAHGRLGRADYFCGVGLSIYGVFGVKTSDCNFAEQTLSSLLSWRKYGKIYIHLGINELGGNLDTYVERYQSVIDRIREQQPDACIILQSVMVLGEGYSSRACFSRESIQGMNDRIRTLAEKNELFFSDVNPILTNEEGYLIPELTYDGCHLYSSAYEIWAQWLLEEATRIPIPEKGE